MNENSAPTPPPEQSTVWAGIDVIIDGFWWKTELRGILIWCFPGAVIFQSKYLFTGKFLRCHRCFKIEGKLIQNKYLATSGLVSEVYARHNRRRTQWRLPRTDLLSLRLFLNNDFWICIQVIATSPTGISQSRSIELSNVNSSLRIIFIELRSRNYGECAGVAWEEVCKVLARVYSLRSVASQWVIVVRCEDVTELPSAST